MEEQLTNQQTSLVLDPSSQSIQIPVDQNN